MSKKNLPKLPEHKSDSAIKVITQKIPVTKKSASVYKTLAMLSQEAKNFETINYVYVTDSQDKLIGVVSIKQLLEKAKESGETLLETLTTTEIISVRPHTSQERVAHLALKHNIKAIPVTDKENTLLGVIPNDRILAIIHQESQEDLLKLTGLYSFNSKTKQPGETIHDDIMKLSLFQSLKRRLPWLILGTFGGLLMAQTISTFESTLEKNLLIAAFIPLMVYMSNAVGQQITVFLIRDASHENNIKYLPYFLRHFFIVVLLGVILSGIIAVFGAISYKDMNIIKILGVGSFATVVSSIFTGFLIPFIFIKLKEDPANASGPVSTVLQDLLSVWIYFVISTAFL